MEFAEITKDPFVNTTNNFFLVVDIANYTIPSPSGPGQSFTSNGKLYDPSGNWIAQWWLAESQDYEVTGSLSDEAFAHSWSKSRTWMLIPPNFKFANFETCLGFWLSPKEVEQFILGRLSLKGGD